MMKKATWKKLFTRNKSKTRDESKAAVVCNLCVGMPLSDVTTLCDKHRNLRSASGNSVLLMGNSITDAAVETQKPPSILKSASPTAVAQPAVEQSVENSDPEQAATPQNTEILRTADESTNAKDVRTFVEEHQHGSSMNEEFMTEELDSTNMSENSHTENPVIVIEPQEPIEETRTITEDIKAAVSHTLLPGSERYQVADDQAAGFKSVVTISDVMASEDEQIFPEPGSSYGTQIRSRKAVANLVWFGSADGPEKSSLEITQRQIDDAKKSACRTGVAEEAAQSTSTTSNGVSLPSSEHPNAGRNQHVMDAHSNNGTMQGNLVSSSLNPTVGEPTPLSTLLPNVFLNAPLDSQAHNIRRGVGFVDAPVVGSANQNPSSDGQIREDDGQSSDEGFEEGGDEQTDIDGIRSAHGSSESQPASSHTSATELPSEVQSPHDGNSPTMIFGTLTTEFSSQPLFFSPNFVFQGMGSVGSYNTQNNMTRQFHEEGRVTEITESTESKRQVGESSGPLGQSPPSLEDEEELDGIARRGEAAEEEKQLKKE